MSRVLKRLYHIGKPLSAQLLEFANGSIIDGILTEYKFGFNPEVTTVEFPVWSEQASYVFLDSPTQINVSSNAITDNAASVGAGAWTVKLTGLNENRDFIVETVILDGNTEVLTNTTFLRINRMRVITAGSSEANEGNIYAGVGGVTDGVPVDIIGKIDIGENQSLQAIYSVPRNNTAFITTFNASVGKTAQTVTVRLKVREENEVFHIQDKIVLLNNSLTIDHIPPLAIQANSDMIATAQTDGGTSDVQANFSIICIAD